MMQNVMRILQRLSYITMKEYRQKLYERKSKMKSLFISRVKIKIIEILKMLMFSQDINKLSLVRIMQEKQIFLRALQLILDPTLSDEDRMLQESDFNDLLVNPMENKEEIVIEIYVDNYSNNKTILTVFQDATVKNEEGKRSIKVYIPILPIY